MIKILNKYNLKLDDLYKILNHNLVYRYKFKGETFYDILKNDNLHEFIQKYDDQFVDNIVAENNISCTNELCNAKTDLEFIFCYNTGKIALYYLHKNKNVTAYSLIRLLKHMNKENTSYNDIKKLFMNCMMYLNITQKEGNHILNLLFKLGDYDLIDLFHTYGYRLEKFNNIDIPSNKYQKMIEIGYKFDFISIKKFITNNMIDDEIEIKKMINPLDLNLYKKDIILSYNKCKLNFIKIIEQMGFKSTQTCLKNAVNGYNFEVIFHLLDSNPDITFDENLIHHLFIQKKIIKKKNDKNIKNKYRRRRSRLFGYKHGIFIKPLKFIGNIENYENSMIKLLKNYTSNNHKKCIIKAGKHILPVLLYNKMNVLYNYLVFNYNINPKSNYITDIIIMKLIVKDDVTGLKLLFETNYIMPIDISSNSDYMNYAIKKCSRNMIKYMSEELHMVCNRHIEHVFTRIYPSYNNLNEIIDILVDLEYPINDAIINGFCDKSSFNIDKIIDLGFKLPSKLIDIMIMKKKFKNVQYLLDNGCIFKKKGAINRMIGLICNYRLWYSKFNINSAIKKLEFVKKIGGTFVDHKLNIHLKRYPGLSLYIYKNFELTKTGAKPDKILNSLYYLTTSTNADQIIEILEYLNDFCGDTCKYVMLNNSSTFYSDILYKICEDSIKDYFKVLEYCVNKFNINLNSLIVHGMGFTKEGLDVLFKIFEKMNIEMERSTKITLLACCPSENIIWLLDKLSITIIEDDILLMIRNCGMGMTSFYILIEKLQINPSIYLVNTIVDSFLNNYWRKDQRTVFFIWVLENINHISNSSYQKIMNSKFQILKDILINSKIEIIDYVPMEHEVLNNNYYYNNYDDDDINQDNIEKNYIDDVLGEIDDVMNNDLVEI